MATKIKKGLMKFIIEYVFIFATLILGLGITLLIIGAFINAINPVLNIILSSIGGSLIGTSVVSFIFKFIDEYTMENLVEGIIQRTTNTILNQTSYLIRSLKVIIEMDVKGKSLDIKRTEMIENVGNTVVKGRKRRMDIYEEENFIINKVTCDGIDITEQVNKSIRKKQIIPIEDTEKDKKLTSYEKEPLNRIIWYNHYPNELGPNRIVNLIEETTYSNIRMDDNSFELIMVHPIKELEFEVIIKNGKINPIEKLAYDEIDPDQILVGLPSPISQENKWSWKLKEEDLKIWFTYGFKWTS
ncbi:MAG: hypothetical protein EAX96_20435 [Candidatus Lokiarchaeota archaeon]|nr:hypothetical protein [Candidatus Lokiarchaeota archaeon]